MRIFKIIFLILWMTLIFCFSNQKAIESTNLSNSFINKTIVKTYKFFYGDLSSKKEEQIIDKYSFFVRKLAHYSLYFILGILSIIVISDYEKNKILIFYSFVICITYACIDEFHQYFIDGRSSSIKDVLIDSIGSISSILLYYIIFKRKKVNHKN